MSSLADSAGARAAVRMRRLDAGVVAQMARSLHREARREREGAWDVGAWESGERARELACAIEAGRVRRALVPRPHPGAARRRQPSVSYPAAPPA
jgi:hypothetical protein